MSSFASNVNTIANKIGVIETATNIFDEGVIPVLQEVSELDLDEAVKDLKKGDYLGNRKIDINLALNIPGVTEELIKVDRVNGTSAVSTTIAALGDSTPRYDKATITFVDGEVIEHPFKNDDMTNSTVASVEGLYQQFTRLDKISAVKQVSKLTNVVPTNNSLYIISVNGITYKYVSDSNAVTEDILTAFRQKITSDGTFDDIINVDIVEDELILTAKTAGTPFTLNVKNPMVIIDNEFSSIVKGIVVEPLVNYTIKVVLGDEEELVTYTSGDDATTAQIVDGLVDAINECPLEIQAVGSATEFIVTAVDPVARVTVELLNNIEVVTTTANVKEDWVETAFNKKLTDTQIAIAPDIPMSIIRFYDVTGRASNLERIVLHVAENSSNNADPVFYLGKTTSSFNVLASRAGDIVKLGAEIDNLITLSNNIHRVMDVQDSLGKLTDGDGTIYDKLPVLQTLYDSLTKVETIYSDLVDTVNGSDINRVSADIKRIDSKINEASNDLQSADSKIKEIANDMQSTDSKVKTVANDIQNSNSKINTLSEDLQSAASKIKKIYDDMVSSSSYIRELATDMQSTDSKINTIANDMQDIDSKITKIANDLQDPGSVIETVSIDLQLGVDSKIGAVSDAIKDTDSALSKARSNADRAETARADAETAQNIAEDARDIAIAKVNEIKNVSVGNTDTVANGTPASVSYDSDTGEFTFSIPQGSKGDSFTIDEQGSADEKSNYDAESKGFSFLDTDNSLLYFKKTDDSGDWADGIVFGKGDTGNGIDRIERTSGDGSAGTDDTYTIYMTDGSTSTFTVHNGANVVLGQDVEAKIEEMALIMY